MKKACKFIFKNKSENTKDAYLTGYILYNILKPKQKINKKRSDE